VEVRRLRQDNFEESIIGFLLLIMLLAVLGQVFFRYVLGTPLRWTEELSRYSYVWLTFIGGAYAIKRRSHICLLYFVQKQVARLLSNVLVFAMFVYVFPSGLRFTLSMYRVLSPALEIPMAFLYLAVILGILLMLFRLVMDSILILQETKQTRGGSIDGNS
jgi:TRAP-type C4-dicarboxylate transport system permease small subunit